MRTSGVRSLVAFVAITFAAITGVLVASWKPLLGLDLQGGVSVVLKPKTDTTPDQLNQAISIIRQRVDSLGVAEPDISRQGANIIVQLPGVKDQKRALALVGETAELRFRPVLAASLSPDAAAAAEVKAAKSGITTTTSAATTASTAAITSTSIVTVGDPTTSTSTAAAATTAAPVSTTSPPTSQKALGSTTEGRPGGIGKGEYALPATTRVLASGTTTAVPTTAAPPPTAAPPTTTVGSIDPTATTVDLATQTVTNNSAAATGFDLTPSEQDDATKTVVLGQFDKTTKKEGLRYLLGPALMTGKGVDSAQQRLDSNGQWQVSLQFKPGELGVDAWRAAAKECFTGSKLCPTKQLAIVLDGNVLSAPTVNSDFRGETSGVISGSFKQTEATDLATALKYGSLPVELERQQSQQVSATVGEDALRAGVIAGLLGLGLVGIYILLYYRILGMVAISSLALSFGLLWSIISYLGAKQGLALSLSGVVGIIVSIGISIDSNIVYFETIKDDMHAGRNLRSSAERAFRGAMSTIIKADAVSLIAAVLLYLLTVGPVRGFAFYLGLATVLDLVASYFFMRPAVNLLARTGLAARKPESFGIPAPTRAVEVAR